MLKPQSFFSLWSPPLQFVLGQQPKVSHLRVFGCDIHVLIAPLQGLRWVLKGILELHWF